MARWMMMGLSNPWSALSEGALEEEEVGEDDDEEEEEDDDEDEEDDDGSFDPCWFPVLYCSLKRIGSWKSSCTVAHWCTRLSASMTLP